LGARNGDEGSHYEVLFESVYLRSNPTEPGHSKVTEEMNNALLAPYTVEEVRKALFDIGDLKVPGPDGLHAIFYRRF
jgi:hypothetical protein